MDERSDQRSTSLTSFRCSESLVKMKKNRIQPKLIHQLSHLLIKQKSRDLVKIHLDLVKWNPSIAFYEDTDLIKWCLDHIDDEDVETLLQVRPPDLHHLQLHLFSFRFFYNQVLECLPSFYEISLPVMTSPPSLMMSSNLDSSDLCLTHIRFNLLSFKMFFGIFV